MKNQLLPFLLLVVSFQSIYASSPSFIKHSEALIQRVLSGKANSFVIEQIPSENGKDVFEIGTAENGKILLCGNSELSVAMAFNLYLRDIAKVSYDWYAESPLPIKGELPLPISTIRMECSAQERFFNNTCTFGYTFPFWNWERWEKYIDWLAMNGINRPLMLAGQEKIWLNVWQSFGLKKEDIQAYFSGPAHLPWHRMANLDKWGGPLPISYIEGQYRLQKKILARCRELAMEPVLPAFAGHVPEQLKQVYPEANIHQISPGWGVWTPIIQPIFSILPKNYSPKFSFVFLKSRINFMVLHTDIRPILSTKLTRRVGNLNILQLWPKRFINR
jgi:alpha-N-acetylglucosaminidase